MAKQVIKMLQDTTKVFKAGNSLSVRLTKQDLTKF
ncbi:AbrB family transcriptional regulator, partial [Lactobacillus crispatus]